MIINALEKSIRIVLILNLCHNQSLNHNLWLLLNRFFRENNCWESSTMSDSERFTEENLP